MNRVVLDLDVLRQNLARIDDLMREHGATWTLVTKVICGHEPTLRALAAMGVTSIGDSRRENLLTAEDACPELERWYLRPPQVSTAELITARAHVSLNTEIESLRALDTAARNQGRIHRVVIMVEIGELREGVLPGGLLSFFRQAESLANIEVLGIGANLGCLSGTVPTIEQLAQLPLYHKLIEHEFDVELPFLSAGSSVVLPALVKGNVPEGINHYRIGEAAFLGTDLIHGGQLEGLENAMVIEGEVVEVREKNLVPLGEISEDIKPFDSTGEVASQPGERGLRALVAIGQLDTDVGGLTPLDPDHTIVGASSDISVVNLGANRAGIGVGDAIRFRPDYSAAARAMSGKYLRVDTISRREAARPEGSDDPRSPAPSAAGALRGV